MDCFTVFQQSQFALCPFLTPQTCLYLSSTRCPRAFPSFSITWLQHLFSVLISPVVTWAYSSHFSFPWLGHPVCYVPGWSLACWLSIILTYNHLSTCCLFVASQPNYLPACICVYGRGSLVSSAIRLQNLLFLPRRLYFDVYMICIFIYLILILLVVLIMDSN